MRQAILTPLAFLAILALGVPLGVHDVIHAWYVNYDWMMGIHGTHGANTVVPVHMHCNDEGMVSYNWDCEYCETMIHGHHGMVNEVWRNYRRHYINDTAFNTITVSGVVEKQEYRTLVVRTGNESMVVIKLHRTYIDQSNGYFTSGERLYDHIKVGDKVIVELSGRSNVALTIIWANHTYTLPWI